MVKFCLDHDRPDDLRYGPRRLHEPFTFFLNRLIRFDKPLNVIVNGDSVCLGTLTQPRFKLWIDRNYYARLSLTPSSHESCHIPIDLETTHPLAKRDHHSK